MTQQINLFNPIFRKQKKYFSSVTMVQALAIICVACALLAIDAAYRMRALNTQAAATAALLADRQQRLTEVKVQFAPRQKSATLAAEIVAAQDELAMLQSATATVRRGGFGDTVGFSGYYRAFARQSIPGLWLTDVKVASGGATIGIGGNALQAPLVPQYMGRLAQEPVMKGKAFATLSMNEVAPGQVVLVGGASAQVALPAVPAYLKFSLQSVNAGKGAAVAKMRKYWLKISGKIDGMTLRERCIVFVAAAGVIIFAMFHFFLNPTYVKQKATLATMSQQRDTLAGVEAEIAQTMLAHTVDPDAADRARLQLVKAEAQSLSSALMAMQQGMVPPERMTGLLERILRAHRSLRLTSLRTLPEEVPAVTTPKPGEAAPPPQLLHRHGVELVLQGSYPDMVAYMAALEGMQGQIFWGSATMKVDTHPSATLTLVVYTISLDKKWLKL